ncbi:MAG: HD domain-containing protein [Desulfobacula sp.]|nr:HD domain-containing protein [Desulfobacula sp.]
MKQIANLLFEVRILKDLKRSGYAFLGSGTESVAEHSFMTAFICFALAKMDSDVDGERLVAMALVHDLAEARTGDLNYVEKKYSTVDEAKAVSHLTANLPFGEEIKYLVEEFNAGESKEAMLAKDADQLAFILELKKLDDIGAKGPDKWLTIVLKRLKTPEAKQLAQSIMETNWDEWWTNDYSE